MRKPTAPALVIPTFVALAAATLGHFVAGIVLPIVPHCATEARNVGLAGAGVSASFGTAALVRAVPPRTG